MKTNKYEKRLYRDWVYAKSLHKNEIIIKETDLQIITDKPLDKEFVLEKINFYRSQIEDYINYKDRRFLTALKPIAIDTSAGRIIKEMARCSQKANVGPMACVAGAIAQFLGKDLLKKGYRDVIVENGGDIFLKTTHTIKVGLYSGKEKKINKISLKIRPEDSPLGICSSSGTIGHSLSFGLADSVVIIAKDAILADAAATCVANLVTTKKDFQKAIARGRLIKGVLGIAIILKDNLASWGRIEFM